jgi:hypothetical protein
MEGFHPVFVNRGSGGKKDKRTDGWTDGRKKGRREGGGRQKG